jgi:seryl-tRNA synthetase
MTDLDRAVNNMPEESHEAKIAKVTNGAISELANQFISLRDKKSELENQVKELNQQMDTIQATVANILIESDMQSAKTADGPSVYLQNDIRVSCKQEFNEQLFTFLRQHGHQDAIKETVHNRTLLAVIKELKETTEIPVFITVNENLVARFRR